MTQEAIAWAVVVMTWIFVIVPFVTAFVSSEPCAGYIENMIIGNLLTLGVLAFIFGFWVILWAFNTVVMSLR